MLLMRGMGVASDPDAPMVPSWADDAPPKVTVTSKAGKKTYVFEDPIEITSKIQKAKAPFPWLPVIGVVAALGAAWAWTKYGSKGRSRPKAHRRAARRFAHA